MVMFLGPLFKFECNHLLYLIPYHATDFLMFWYIILFAIFSKLLFVTNTANRKNS